MSLGTQSPSHARPCKRCTHEERLLPAWKQRGALRLQALTFFTCTRVHAAEMLIKKKKKVGSANDGNRRMLMTL